jgi:hypothetical protein
MSTLTINLPDNLHKKACEVAASKNLSTDALVRRPAGLGFAFQ